MNFIFIFIYVRKKEMKTTKKMTDVFYYNETTDWIEKIIKSSSLPEHEKVCQKLINNFLDQVLRDLEFSYLHGLIHHKLYRAYNEKFVFTTKVVN